MIPLITRETPLVRRISELVLGVNIFDLDFGVQISSVKQPMQRNSVGLRHVSHRRTSAFNDHFDHRFTSLPSTSVQLGFEVRKFCVCDNVH